MNKKTILSLVVVGLFISLALVLFRQDTENTPTIPPFTPNEAGSVSLEGAEIRSNESQVENNKNLTEPEALIYGMVSIRTGDCMPMSEPEDGEEKNEGSCGYQGASNSTVVLRELSRYKQPKGAIVASTKTSAEGKYVFYNTVVKPGKFYSIFVLPNPVTLSKLKEWEYEWSLDPDGEFCSKLERVSEIPVDYKYSHEYETMHRCVVDLVNNNMVSRNIEVDFAQE